MPSVSKKQHNFMEAIAHNPAFSKKVGVSQSVGKDFATADKGKKFKKGGAMKDDMKEDMKMDKAQDKAMIKKAFKEHDAQEHKGGAGTQLSLKKGGNVKKMAKGGMAMKESMGPRTMAKDVEAGSNKLTKFGQSAVQKRGMTKGTNLGDSGPSMGMMGGMKKGGKIKKMASGGMTSSRADGVAQRGKTKTKYC